LHKDKNILKLCLKIDSNTIYEFYEKINEKSIITSAKHIEELLIKNSAKPEKIQNVYEIMIEIMQNILNNSYDNTDLKNNKKEASGVFILSYNRISDRYTLQSCNLIENYQVDIIKERLKETVGLDDNALRKLSLKKMRHKKDNHEKGAGLGFIMMARKSIEPIEVTFLPYEDNILKYKLLLVL